MSGGRCPCGLSVWGDVYIKCADWTVTYLCRSCSLRIMKCRRCFYFARQWCWRFPEGATKQPNDRCGEWKQRDLIDPVTLGQLLREKRR